jgi:hypothetical protein
VSYTIELQTRGGSIEWRASGDVPDGSFLISGHRSSAQEDLSVQRRDAAGQFAGTAAHAHPVTDLARADPAAARPGGTQI